MILVSRIKLGLIKARAKYIEDYAYEDSIKTVAEMIVQEIESAEKEEDEQWQKGFSRRFSKMANG